jgi:ABC-type Na+ efflux pump permease subunit
MKRLLRNPVFGKELLVQLRRGSSFYIAFFYLAALLGTLVAAWPDPHRRFYRIETLGIEIMLLLGSAVLVLGPLAAGVISSISLVSERESETFELLKVSLLSVHKVIIGKLCSSLAYVFILIIATLPALGLVYILGGVTIAQLFSFVGIVFANTLVWGMTGMACSVLLRKSYLCMLLFIIIYGGIGFGLCFPCFFWAMESFRGLRPNTEVIQIVMGSGILGLVVSLALAAFLLLRLCIVRERRLTPGRLLMLTFFALALLLMVVSGLLILQPTVYYRELFLYSQNISYYLALINPFVPCFKMLSTMPGMGFPSIYTLADAAKVWATQFSLMYIITWIAFRRPESSHRKLLDVVLAKGKSGGKSLRQLLAVRWGPIKDGGNPLKALEVRRQRIGNPYFLSFVGVILFLLSFAGGWFTFIYFEEGFDSDYNVGIPICIWGAALLLAPAYAAVSISTERNRKTWDLLATTLLTPRQIVRGKHAINMRFTLTIFLTALCGIWLFCVYYSLFDPYIHGPRDHAWALIVGPLLAWISLRFASALGIALSSFTKKPIAALLGSYAILLLLYPGSVLFVMLIGEYCHFRNQLQMFYASIFCGQFTVCYVFFEPSRDERWLALLLHLWFYLSATFFLLRIAERRICRKE